MRDAACVGLEIGEDGFDPFFPRRGETARALETARKLCDDCPVRAACLEHRRITGSKFGIWAGNLYNPQKAGT